MRDDLMKRGSGKKLLHKTEVGKREVMYVIFLEFGYRIHVVMSLKATE